MGKINISQKKIYENVEEECEKVLNSISHQGIKNF